MAVDLAARDFEQGITFDPERIVDHCGHVVLSSPKPTVPFAGRTRARVGERLQA